MQNSRASVISANASRNLFFARTCGGMTTTGAGVIRFLRHQINPAMAALSTINIAPTQIAQTHPLGISTGALIGRMSFVTALAVEGGGTIRALFDVSAITKRFYSCEFVSIRGCSGTAQTPLFPDHKKASERG